MNQLKNLYRKSIEVIKENQSDFGLYEASPNFKNYKYCWLRDSTFIAYSMDIIGNNSSSRKFYSGINRIIKKKRNEINKLIREYDKNGNINKNNMLPARFTLKGEVTNTDWEEFQLDGYGIWLWGLYNHLKISKDLELVNSEFRDSIDLLVRYLKTFWKQPNYDCWEENGDKVHPSTISSIYGGLLAIGNNNKDIEILKLCEVIKNYVINNCIRDNHVVKFIGSSEVDSSLLWLSTPFELLEDNNRLMKGTLKKIEKDLFKDGLKRYKNDEYYGGGIWPLLTAQIGWNYFRMGEIKIAREMLERILEFSDEEYNLPEQVPENLNHPRKYLYWKNKWGKIAKPLLWSHAMYLILYTLLDKGDISEN